MDMNKMVYTVIEGERLDTGTPEGYLRAIIRYAASIPEYRAVLLDELSEEGLG